MKIVSETNNENQARVRFCLTDEVRNKQQLMNKSVHL